MKKLLVAALGLAMLGLTIVRHCHAFVVKFTSGTAQTAVRVFSKPRTFIRVKSDGVLLASAIGKAQGC